MALIARSLLFVPGDRPERFAKAAASGAHEMIIDLEDAVAPNAKGNARDAISDWLAAGQAATVRINSADTQWFADDIAMLSAFPAVKVMLAKAEAEPLAAVRSKLPSQPMMALVETVRGVIELRQLATTPGLTRIAFGSVDFSVDSGMAEDGDALTVVRTQIVLESRFAGLAAPVDGVSVNFNDADLLLSEATRAQQLGFGGKLCIHPKQVPVVNAVYQPSSEQLAWAQRVFAAFEQSQGGVTTVDGKMIDKPVVEQARRFIDEAAR